MSWEKIFETDDYGTWVIVEMRGKIVQITEAEEQCVLISVPALADIAEAVARHLESAAEQGEEIPVKETPLYPYLVGFGPDISEETG